MVEWDDTPNTTEQNANDMFELLTKVHPDNYCTSLNSNQFYQVAASGVLN